MSKLLWWVASGMWAIGIWWLSDQPDLSSGLSHDFVLRKMAHVGEFAVLTWLLFRSLRLHVATLSALYIAAALTLAYAGIDEWHQTWVPGREGKTVDVLIDSTGVVAAAVFIRWRTTAR